MENIYKISSYFILGLIILTEIITSCKDKDELGNAPRLFRPILQTETGDGQNWISANWTDITAASSFTIDLSTDSFKTIYKTKTTDTASCLFENLDWDKEYQIRVRSNGTDKIDTSGYYVVNGIKIIYPTLLLNATTGDVIDLGIRPQWSSNAGKFTSLKIFKMPKDSFVKEVPLTAQDTTNKYKEILGLNPSTTYKVIAYSGDSYKGYKQFTTVPAEIYDIPIDLRGIDDATASAMITTTYLQGLADGSTVILKRGLTYAVSGTVSCSKSVTFATGLGFGNNLATFNLTAGNFNVTASSVVGQVYFKNVNLLGDATAYGARYVFNINTACTLGKILMEGCKVKSLRGVIRVQSGPTTIDTVRFNNCIVDSIKDYGVVNSDNASALIKNIKVTNSTISDAQKLFVNSKSSGTQSIFLNNCTFCYAPIGGSYIMDYTGRTISNGVTVTNCIFGAGKMNTTTDKDSIQGFKGTANFTTSGNYKTSDLLFKQLSPSPFPGLDSYSGKTTDLFKNPTQDDFTIIDKNFSGKTSSGDPRWR